MDAATHVWRREARAAARDGAPYSRGTVTAVRRTATALLAVAIALAAASPPIAAAEYDLFVLAGQSNMVGHGKNADLETVDLTGIEVVRIFHGTRAFDGGPPSGLGLWAPLEPGFGTGFTSDGETNHLGQHFGPELTIARRLLEARPGRKIALVKYAKGGTTIDPEAAGRSGCWEPRFDGGAPHGPGRGTNQYDHFLATLAAAASVADIDGDGEPDRLVPRGIFWMQGENDAASTREVAERYESNLTRLVRRMRSALGEPRLPVVIGRISDSGQGDGGSAWNFAGLVREAQASFVEGDEHAALVTATDSYGYSDPWHYDSAGYLDLGVRFVEAWLSIVDR